MRKDYYKLHEDVCFKRAGGKIIWQPRIICWINDKMLIMVIFPVNTRAWGITIFSENSDAQQDFMILTAA